MRWPDGRATPGVVMAVGPPGGGSGTLGCEAAEAAAASVEGALQAQGSPSVSSVRLPLLVRQGHV